MPIKFVLMQFFFFFFAISPFLKTFDCLTIRNSSMSICSNVMVFLFASCFLCSLLDFEFINCLWLRPHNFFFCISFISFHFILFFILFLIWYFSPARLTTFAIFLTLFFVELIDKTMFGKLGCHLMLSKGNFFRV